MGQQGHEGIGGGIGSGLVRRSQYRHHHRAQIRFGDDLRVQAVLTDAVVHPALAIRTGHHVIENFLRRLPEAAHVVGNGQLLVGCGTSPGVQSMGHRELAQLLRTLFGHPQKAQGHRERDLVEHGLHQIDPAGIDEPVHVLLRHRTHHRFEADQVLGQEGVHQKAPAGHVVGLVLVDHRAVHGKAIGLQDFKHLRRGGRHLLQGYRR